MKTSARRHRRQHRHRVPGMPAIASVGLAFAATEAGPRREPTERCSQVRTGVAREQPPTSPAMARATMA